jgi:hypothetical protein
MQTTAASPSESESESELAGTWWNLDIGRRGSQIPPPNLPLVRV